VTTSWSISNSPPERPALCKARAVLFVERTLLSAAFDFDFKLQPEINVNGGGQECPPYTVF